MEQKDFLYNVALHLDMFNTVSGGISKTHSEVEKYDQCAVIKVWAAGVKPEIFKITINDNKLTLYAGKESCHNSEVIVPIFNQTFILPPAINISEIEAVYKKGKLKVTLPYYEWAGKHREIKIEQL